MKSASIVRVFAMMKTYANKPTTLHCMWHNYTEVHA